MSAQLPLFATPSNQPEGLRYTPDVLNREEETELIRMLAELPFAPFAFHGFQGKRRTVSFGWHYRFDGSGLEPAAPMPEWLLRVRDTAGRWAGINPATLVHALIIEYQEGAGIGWHRDRPVFGEVLGLSLGAPVPLRFRRRHADRWQRFTLEAEPRSAYLLTGPAREAWEHSILAVERLRYSITFRTLRDVPHQKR